jgi:hypothetical protein
LLRVIDPRSGGCGRAALCCIAELHSARCPPSQCNARIEDEDDVGGRTETSSLWVACSNAMCDHQYPVKFAFGWGFHNE